MSGGEIAPPQISVRSGTSYSLSVEQRAIYDAGNKLFADSITTGVEYCKTMIGIATGAIALYYALFTYLVPEKYEPNEMVDLLIDDFKMKVVILIPPILFLASAASFVWGYFPRSQKMNLRKLLKTDPADGTSVEEARQDAISHRKIWGGIGTVLFVAGLIAASLVVMKVANAEAKDASPQRAIVVRNTGEVLCGDLASGEGRGQVVLVPRNLASDQNPLVIDDASQVHLVEKCP